MTATGHAILGAIIAAKAGNPAIAIPLAFASHIAADAIPHWDTGTNARKKGERTTLIHSFFDVLIGFIVSFLIIILFFPKTDLTYVLLIILVSQSPDWLTSLYYFFHIKFFKFTYDFQKLYDNCLDKPWGIIIQATVLLTILTLAVIF